MSRFANLSTRLSADLPDPNRPYDDEEDECNADREEGTKKKKEKPMADETVSAEAHAKAVADAKAEATAAANARYSAVLASDEYQGREALATNLLGNASMDANAIIGALAASPRAAPAMVDADAAAKAAEQGGREEMKAALAETNNSDVEGNGGDVADKPTAKVDTDKVWAKAYKLDEKGVK